MHHNEDVFSYDDWHTAVMTDAPVQSLLEAEPLWFTRLVTNYRETLSAHASTACTGFLARAADMARLDVHALDVSEPGTALRMCACTMHADASLPHGEWLHPLRLLISTVNVLALMRSAAESGTWQNVRNAELDLEAVTQHARAAMSAAANRTGLAPWTDWLANMLSTATRQVDTARARQYETSRPYLAPGPLDVLVQVGLLGYTSLDVLNAYQRSLLTACPVEVRCPGTSTLVVRAPKEFAAAIARDPSIAGRQFHQLGELRPMTDRSWRMYQQLIDARYPGKEAYRVAADLASLSDADNIYRVLDQLIEAHVPSGQLVETAITLAS